MSRWITGMWAGGSAIALGRDLAELAADDEQAVRRLDQIVGDARIAAEQTRPTAGACRRCRPCRSSCARPGSTAPRRSAAARSRPRDRWMPPPTSSSGRLASAISFAARSISARSGRMRRAGAFSVAASIDEILGGEIVRAVADILGHVEQYRPRPPRGRHREGAPHQFGNAARHARRGSAP